MQSKCKANAKEMALKICMFIFILTSITLSLLYIPTQLSGPITEGIKQLKNFNNILTNSNNSGSSSSSKSKQYPVTFAYLISASKGDVSKLKRVLHALYHPGNHYLIHMDSGAELKEHQEIARFVSEEPVFKQVGNVWVVKKPNLVTYRGPTMLATTLHGMAILLRTAQQWDWFINLSASDYPLVTQDGMI